MEPARLSRLLRGDLDWIVMKALEKDRGRRYESAHALAQDIERYLEDEPVLAGPPSPLYRLRKLVRRNRGAVVAAALVLLTLLLGIAGTTWGLLEAQHQRDLAEEARQEAVRQRDRAEAEKAEADRLRREAELAKAAADKDRERTRDSLFQFLRSGTLPPRSHDPISERTVGPTLGEAMILPALRAEKARVSPARSAGMKAALADIGRGVLKQKYPAYPEFPQLKTHAERLKKDYGIETEIVHNVNDLSAAEMAGYNDVMRVEIEHRFGPRVLEGH
jgi:hypothetical protein